MLKTRVDRIPIELFDLAKDRSKYIGQSKAQAYRDIVSIAKNVNGMICTPARDIKKPEKKDEKIFWDFKI